MEAVNSHLLAAYEPYREWLSHQTVVVPENLRDYRPAPGFDINFIAHAAVPIKLIDGDEVLGLDALMRQPLEVASQLDAREYLHRVVTARFANLVNSRLQNEINFVSLGCDCLPRVLFSKWGLRPTRTLGEHSLPFDLALANDPRQMIRIIKEDIQGLFNPELLSVTPILDCPFNDSYLFCFNHEVGKYWYERRFRRLFERYETRIQRFRKLQNNGKPTFYVMNFVQPIVSIAPIRDFSEDADAELPAALEALAARTEGPTRLLCVLTGTRVPLRFRETVTTKLSPTASVTRIYNPTPSDNYFFFDPQFYASNAGLKYETGIMKAVRDLVDVETGIRIDLGVPAPAIAKSLA